MSIDSVVTDSECRKKKQNIYIGYHNPGWLGKKGDDGYPVIFQRMKHKPAFFGSRNPSPSKCHSSFEIRPYLENIGIRDQHFLRQLNHTVDGFQNPAITC